MINRKHKILLIDGSSRQVLIMAKSLRELGHEVTTYNSRKSDFGYASRYPHRKLLLTFDLKRKEPRGLTSADSLTRSGIPKIRCLSYIHNDSVKITESLKF